MWVSVHREEEEEEEEEEQEEEVGGVNARMPLGNFTLR